MKPKISSILLLAALCLPSVSMADITVQDMLGACGVVIKAHDGKKKPTLIKLRERAEEKVVVTKKGEKKTVEIDENLPFKTTLRIGANRLVANNAAEKAAAVEEITISIQQGLETKHDRPRVMLTTKALNNHGYSATAWTFSDTLVETNVGVGGSNFAYEMNCGM